MELQVRADLLQQHARDLSDRSAYMQQRSASLRRRSAALITRLTQLQAAIAHLTNQRDARADPVANLKRN
jgi:hypothetical protein